MNVPTDLFEKVFSNKNKILIVFSHPDDAELYSGGTIARLTSSGREVRIVKMTMGEKGSKQEKVSEEELKKIRLASHSSQYSLEAAKDSADFFTKQKGTDRRYERFRYVIAD